MSIPTLSGMTLVDNAESSTNWSGWGGNNNKNAASTELYKQGVQAFRTIFNTGNTTGGIGVQSGSSIDATANLIALWVNCVSDKQFKTLANKGVFVRITDSTTGWTTNYLDYYVGGSDVKWVGSGWHLIVLDANRTADASGGSVSKTAIRRIGVGYSNTGVTASHAPSLIMDSVWYGSGVEVTGPSFTDGTNGIDINSDGTIDRNDGGSFVTDGWEVGDYVKIVGSATPSNDGVYEITAVSASALTTGETFTQDTANTTVSIYCSVTFEDIYQKDGPTDDNWKGVIDKDLSGGYIINYPLTIGDASGSGDCFFLSLGESVTFADQLLNTTREDYIITVEDTGKTYIQIGKSSGTADDRVGFGGPVFIGQDSVLDSYSGKTPRGLDLGAEITGLEFFGSLISKADGGVGFAPTGSSHYGTNLTFDACGQVDLGGIEARNLTFSGYSSSSDAALLWNESINIKNSRFLANTDPTNDPAAIEHPSAVGSPYAYNGLSFSGNDYDINNTSGSVITIDAIDSDPATSKGSSVTINNAVTLNIYVKDADGNNISGAQCAIYKSSDDTQLMNEDSDVNGLATETFNYPGSEVDIYYRVRKSSSGDSRYIPVSSIGTITTGGFTVSVVLYKDTTLN